MSRYRVVKTGFAEWSVLDSKYLRHVGKYPSEQAAKIMADTLNEGPIQ